MAAKPENIAQAPCAYPNCPWPHLNGSPFCRKHVAQDEVERAIHVQALLQRYQLEIVQTSSDTYRKTLADEIKNLSGYLLRHLAQAVAAERTLARQEQERLAREAQEAAEREKQERAEYERLVAKYTAAAIAKRQGKKQDKPPTRFLDL